MKSIQYVELLKRAFVTTWNNKFLWIFGLAILLGSVGLNIDINDISKIEQFNQDSSVISFIRNYPNLFDAISGILIAITIVLFLFKFIAVAAIIKSISNISLFRQLSFKEIIIEAKTFFWKLIFLEVAIGLCLLVVIMVLFAPVAYLFILKANAIAVIMTVAAIVIVVPLMFLAYYLKKYAYFFLILLNMDMKTAFESSYVTFKNNIIPSFLMSVVMLVVGCVFLSIIFVLFVVVAFPFFVIGLLAYWFSLEIAMFVILAVALIVMVLFLTAMFSWFEAFMQTVWVYFFQQIAFEKFNKEELAEEAKIKGEISIPEIV